MSEQFPVHATAQAVTGARPVSRGAGRAVTSNDVHSNSFQSKLDPFFTGKHTVREAYTHKKRVTYWLDYCGRRHK